MRYVNNWITRLTGELAQGAGVLPVLPAMLERLDLSDDEQYTLTLVSTLDPEQQAVEIVTIAADGAGHVLTRAREGTSDQTWPAGSYVYASVTAGMLEQLNGGSVGVTSFNDRLGAVVLTEDDVSGALTYIPVNPDSLSPVATSGSYADLADKPFIPATPGDVGAATAAQGAKADSAVQPAALTAGLGTKVDKVAGYGLSQENYTSAEKTKLAGLESSHFKGLYASLAALQAAHPTGAGGDYADVDAGAGVDVVRYLWDVSDTQWVAQTSGGGSMTPAQVKTAYESNADTNAYTDADKTKLAGVAPGATANLSTTGLAEGSNLYFTGARVLATLLSGLSLATGGAIVNTDSVLAAFGKIQRQLNDHFGAGGTAHASVVAGGAAGFMTGSDKTKLDGVAAGATANTSTTSLSEGTNLYFTEARVRASLLTGLSVATNAAIAVTDSVLSALGKLQAQLTAHFGSGGTAHAAATTGAAGFMSAADKTKLDGLNTTAAPAISSGTLALAAVTADTVQVSLNQNITAITLPAGAAGVRKDLLIRFTQDATGGRTVAGWTGVTWESGSTPAIASAANASTMIVLSNLDNGGWYGFVDQGYRPDNILGTVSQAAGVPAGAIIERGSNANGEYVRFADGTQVCFASKSDASAAISNAYLGGFRSAGLSWTFPAAFASAPFPSASPGDINSGFDAAAVGPSTTSTTYIYTAVTSQAAATRTVYLIAIGRWF